MLLKKNEQPKEADSLFRWIYNRTVVKNKNCILAVVGSPGTGKSYSCLRILERQAELMGRKPDINNCCRTVKEFMTRINSGELKKGDVIILEEVGVNISARQWQSLVNKLFNYLLQTFRNLNLTVLLNLPDIRMLDINAQRVLHGIITTKKINYETNTSKVTLKVRQHNFQTHKDYWKFLRVRKGNAIIKVKYFTLNKANESIITEYEKRRKEFTDDLNREIWTKIVEFESKKKSNKGEKPLSPRQKEIWELNLEGKNEEEIAKELKITKGMVYTVQRAIQKKGYVIN